MNNEKLNDSVEFPDPKHDYHGHPNYERIFLSLLVLFGLSLVMGYLFSPFVAIALIFVTAAWKCILVIKNFMHLRYEPILVWVAVAAVLFCLISFFFGVYPDITAVHREVTPRF